MWYDANMDPLVKDYLRNHTFQQLEDEHGVYARFSADESKASLNYDTILTKSGDTIAEQCRGLIIRPTQFKKRVFGERWRDAVVGEVDVLAWPLVRFYNHGDPAATDIDWSHPSLRVYEKLDGTMIVLYWDPLHGEWHAGTRSVPEADLPIQVGHMEIGDTTFSQLFWKALHTSICDSIDITVCWSHPSALINDFLDVLDKGLTYVFELTGPYNNIVVKYDRLGVTLLAIRRTQTGEELAIDTMGVEVPWVRRPKTWEIRDIASLTTFVDNADPSQLEGAVVCVQAGGTFQRLKVKNKTYVLAHKAKDSVMSSPRNALEVIIREKVDDIAPIVPANVKDTLLKMQDAYRRFCKDTDDSYVKWDKEASGDRKAFALLVIGSGSWPAPFFNLWEGRAENTREWIRDTCEQGKLSNSTLDKILSKLTLSPTIPSP